MPTYKAPVDDVQFLLNDVFHTERYGNLPGFSDVSHDTLAALLQVAAKLAEEVVQPPNPRSRPTAATGSPGTRFSFPPVSMTYQRTSSIWCSRAPKVRRPASKASRSSSCRKSTSTKTVRSEHATA